MLTESQPTETTSRFWSQRTIVWPDAANRACRGAIPPGIQRILPRGGLVQDALKVIRKVWQARQAEEMKPTCITM
jgi:hypothetical protein